MTRCCPLELFVIVEICDDPSAGRVIARFDSLSEARALRRELANFHPSCEFIVVRIEDWFNCQV